MENEVKDLEIQYEISKEEIKRLIYTIRGKQVMIDSDVARLYHYKTKVLNLTVRRNIERFPEEFCFQLTENEFQTLRFQIETSKQSTEISNNLRGGKRYLPYVFTEQGIAMLAGVLKNDIAVKVSLNIINSFIEMRKFIASNGLAKKNKNVEVTILTSIKSNIQNIDIQKFNKEYPTLKVARTDKFHDRFVLLDSKEMYHLGASIKDLGKKCFAISKVENEEMINLIKRVI